MSSVHNDTELQTWSVVKTGAMGRKKKSEVHIVTSVNNNEAGLERCLK